MYESLEGKILGGHCVQESLLISHSHIYGVATDRFAKKKKKIWNASRICVSSLRRGHANLLCIVPI